MFKKELMSKGWYEAPHLELCYVYNYHSEQYAIFIGGEIREIIFGGHGSNKVIHANCLKPVNVGVYKKRAQQTLDLIDSVSKLEQTASAQRQPKFTGPLSLKHLESISADLKQGIHPIELLENLRSD